MQKPPAHDSFVNEALPVAEYEKVLQQNNFAGRTVGEILDAIAKIADANRKGEEFEKLTQWALPLIKPLEIKHPVKNLGARDIGVDLVAQNNSGKQVAVQCKFYTTGNIQRPALQSFVAGAEQRKIKIKWIVCGHHILGGVAADYARTKNIKIIDLRQYREVVLTTKKRKSRAPNDLQKPAIENVLRGFQNAEAGDKRGKLIMACGTGKTFVASPTTICYN